LAQGPRFTAIVRTHLYGHEPIGVYPLTDNDTVGWCGVDLDEGDHDSIIHAANLAEVAAHFGITAWTELSRSKGCHCLIFLTEQTSAALARLAMKAACQIADAPSLEVYPKQVTADGGWGNGLRLPYGRLRPPGRQVVITDTLQEMPVDQWVQAATAKRTTPPQLEALAAVHAISSTPRAARTPTATTHRSRWADELGGVAKQIWHNGGNDAEDRSKSLYAFAVSAIRQGFPTHDVEALVVEVDDRHFGKFVTRSDQTLRISDLVAKAQLEAPLP
jgi:hypothetical protein